MPISANSGEYKSVVGLDDLYVAEVTVDTEAAFTADTPEYFAPAAEASLEPSVNTETQYADNIPYDVISAEGETKITLTVTGIPLEMLAKVTGKVFDAATGQMWDDAEGIAPYMALSFRALKSNGSYRYFQYLKGRFEMPSMEAATKADSPDIKTQEIIYTALSTVHKFDVGLAADRSMRRIVGDEDTTNFDGASWFSQVNTPVTTSPSALSLSSSTPADAATGVSVSANQTLTFNNALVDAAIYAVSLIKASDGSVVAGSITLDATKKIITIDPTASLTGSTAYIIAYNVTDIYGQHLSGAVNFTTA